MMAQMGGGMGGGLGGGMGGGMGGFGGGAGPSNAGAVDDDEDEDDEDEDDDADDRDDDDEGQTEKKKKKSKIERMFGRKNLDVLTDTYQKLVDKDAGSDNAGDDDSDGDVLTIKRRDHKLESDGDDEELDAKLARLTGELLAAMDESARLDAVVREQSGTLV